MEDKKLLLIQLIEEDNLSAIETFSDKLGISKEDVIALLKELQTEGKLQGTLTSDQKRFFKSQVKVSEAPIMGHSREAPSFLNFNARPGLVTAFIGFIIIIAGVLANTFLTIENVGDISALLIFIGLCILIVGLFLVARRKTPD